MCNSVENAARARVLELAKELHESIRDTETEWDKLYDAAQAVYIEMARRLLARYALLPLDNVHACSGCLTLTNAINDMDESRRLKVQADGELEEVRESLDCSRRDYTAVLQEARHLREVLVVLVGASDPQELEAMKIAIVASNAPAEDKARILAAIYTLLNNSPYSTPAVTTAQEVPL